MVLVFEGPVALCSAFDYKGEGNDKDTRTFHAQPRVHSVYIPRQTRWGFFWSCGQQVLSP